MIRAIQCRREDLTPAELDSLTGLFTRPRPDMDGHYWTKHARYIDLCDDCGDDEEIER